MIYNPLLIGEWTVHDLRRGVAKLHPESSLGDSHTKWMGLASVGRVPLHPVQCAPIQPDHKVEAATEPGGAPSTPCTPGEHASGMASLEGKLSASLCSGQPFVRTSSIYIPAVRFLGLSPLGTSHRRSAT